MITQKYLRSILDYNPETGVFTRKRRDDVRPEWNTRWAGKVAGNKHNQGYIELSINNKKYLAHRVAFVFTYGYWPNEVDHINGVRDDNRIINLREVTSSENKKNMKRAKNNTSGRTGVHYDKINKKWRASAWCNNKEYFAGRFKTKDEAINARKLLEIKLKFHANHDRVIKKGA